MRHANKQFVPFTNSMHVIYYRFRIKFINNSWYLYDGNGKKGSTNGTWLFAEKDLQIFDNMTFKEGNYLFKATVYE